MMCHRRVNTALDIGEFCANQADERDASAIVVPALVAQLVEHLICNQGVGGSNPSGGTTYLV